MIIQVITFETTLSEEEVLAVAEERADRFRALPGLVQKYYFRGDQPNSFGGVYLWDSRESLAAYRQSDLASTIAEAYRVVGQPEIRILESLFALREA